MAAPSVTEVAHGQSGSGTSASARAPSSRVAGDVLVAALYLANGGEPTSSHVAPGWTPVAGAPVATGDDFEVWVFTRIATGGSADDVVARWSGSAVYAQFSVLRVSGAAPSATIDVVGAASVGTSTVPLATSVTTSVPDTLLLWLVGTSNPTALTPPPGFADHSGGGCGIGSAVQSAAGASGERAGALDIANPWAAVMLAIAPAPAGGVRWRGAQNVVYDLRTSMTCPLPAGVEAGDALWLGVQCDGDARSVIATPPGWRRVLATYSEQVNYTWLAYWRVHDGGGPPTVTWGDTPLTCSALMGAWGGADRAVPISGWASATAATATPTAPEVTTTEADSLVAWIAMSGTQHATVEPPAGFALRATDPGHSDLHIAEATMAVPGATGPLSGVLSSAGPHVAAAFALRPASKAPLPGAYANGEAGTSLTPGVGAPIPRRAGDLLTAHLYLYSPTARFVDPVGWTLIHQTFGSTFQIVSYARIATADQNDVFQVTLRSSVAYTHAGMLVFTGVDASRPIDVVDPGRTGSSSAPSANGLTTTGDDRLVVWCMSADAQTSTTIPPGFTQRDGHLGVLVATSHQRRAGATGVKTGGMGSSQPWATHMFALTPALTGAMVAHYDGSAWIDQELHGYDGGAWAQSAGIEVL